MVSPDERGRLVLVDRHTAMTGAVLDNSIDMPDRTALTRAAAGAMEARWKGAVLLTTYSGGYFPPSGSSIKYLKEMERGIGGEQCVCVCEKPRQPLVTWDARYRMPWTWIRSGCTLTSWCSWCGSIGGVMRLGDRTAR